MRTLYIETNHNMELSSIMHTLKQITTVTGKYQKAETKTKEKRKAKSKNCETENENEAKPPQHLTQPPVNVQYQLHIATCKIRCADVYNQNTSGRAAPKICKNAPDS